jgi:copper chaperone CopZ
MEINLDIKGMTCSSCVGHVEKALNKVAGENSAAVNLATEKARVTIPEGSQITTDDLIKAVKDAGYEATNADSTTTTTNITTDNIADNTNEPATLKSFFSKLKKK